MNAYNYKIGVCEKCIHYKKKTIFVGICELFHSLKKKDNTCENFKDNTEIKRFKKIIIKNGKKIYI